MVFFARDPLLDLQEPWHHFDTLEESLIPLPKFVERSPTNAMNFLYHTKVSPLFPAVCSMPHCATDTLPPYRQRKGQSG